MLPQTLLNLWNGFVFWIFFFFLPIISNQIKAGAEVLVSGSCASNEGGRGDKGCLRNLSAEENEVEWEKGVWG